VSVDTEALRRRCADCGVGIRSGYVRCPNCIRGGSGAQVQLTYKSPSNPYVGTFDPKCTCAPAVRESVHDLLAQLDGSVAKSWQDDVATIQWFMRTGAVAALERHGYRFEAYGDGGRTAGVLVERIDHAVAATPAQLFLMAYEVTSARDDYVHCWELRGHWHAEHVKLPADRRGEGIKELVALGAKRGRVKGVGSVLRGVRKLEPMTVEEIAAVFS